MPEAVVAQAEVREAPLEDVLFPAVPIADEDMNTFTKALSLREGKARTKATVLLVLRQQGRSMREIASLLEMTPNAVRVALQRARAAGKINELRGLLENDSLALAVESLNHHLKKKDKDATFKTLEGLGHFRNYNNSKMEGGAGFTMPPLTINIVNAPNNGGMQQIVGSAPVGAPREDAV